MGMGKRAKFGKDRRGWRESEKEGVKREEEKETAKEQGKRETEKPRRRPCSPRPSRCRPHPQPGWKHHLAPGLFSWRWGLRIPSVHSVPYTALRLFAFPKGWGQRRGEEEQNTRTPNPGEKGC